MDRLQALRLMQELFAEKTVGVDSDGNTVGQALNQHFLAACMAARPDLPRDADVQAWNRDPACLRNPYTREAREDWANFLREIADGLVAGAPEVAP